MSLSDALADLPEPVFADGYESPEAYLVVLDLPGVSDDSLDVRVDGGRLRIEARREKSPPAAFRYLREGRSLFVDATLPHAPDIAEDGIEGTLEGGTLTLTLPKRGAAGTTIPITAGEGSESGDDTPSADEQ